MRSDSKPNNIKKPGYFGMLLLILLAWSGVVMSASGEAGVTKAVSVDARQVSFHSAPFTYPPTPFALKQAKKKGVAPKTRSEPSIPLRG